LVLAIAVGGSHAQINLNAPTINLTAPTIGLSAPTINLSSTATFRSSGLNNALTQHYGVLKVMASNATANSKLLEIVDQTPAGTLANMYHYGVYYDGSSFAPLGIGASFSGGCYGLMASAMTTGTGTRYGAQITAGNNTTDVASYRFVYGLNVSAGCAANAKMTVYGVYSSTSTGTGATAYAGYFNGNLAYTGNLTKVSDERYKKNVEPMMGSLDRILKLKPCTYDYRADEFKNFNLPKERQLGLVAQEIEEIFPEVVHVDVAPQAAAEDLGKNSTSRSGRGETESTTPPETYKSVDYVSLIPVLIQAIQEQQKEIEQLKETRGYR